MKITDEMVEAFAAGWSAHDCGPGDCCTKAGLERVAPLIAAQAALAERVKIVATIRTLAESLGQQCTTLSLGVAVTAILNEVADQVNTMPTR